MEIVLYFHVTWTLGLRNLPPGPKKMFRFFIVTFHFTRSTSEKHLKIIVQIAVLPTQSQIHIFGPRAI